MTILFPKVLLGDYDEAALWLCTHRYYLCLNVRDFFSAGGQYDLLNGEKLPIPYPAVLKKLMDVMPQITKNLAVNNDLEYLEFNPELYHSKNRLRTWLEQVEKIFNDYPYVYNKRRFRFSELNINLHDFLMYPQKYKLKQSKK
jgi:hypothetical protein